MLVHDWFKNRKIDFAIIRSTLIDYDPDLVKQSFERLQQLLTLLNGQKFHNQLSLSIPDPFPVYLVASEESYLHFWQNYQYSGFTFRTLQVSSLKEAILGISPEPDVNQLDIKKEGEIHIQEPYDTFLYFEALCPLLDWEESKNLILDHFIYLAEYTYSDIAVPGFLPVVCDVGLAKRLTILEAEYQWSWSEFLLKNLHSVDVEIYYIEPDYRKYRIRFDLYRDHYQKICKNICTQNLEFRYKNLKDIIEHHIDFVRIAPTWIEVELTNVLHLQPKIYPYQNKEKCFLPLDVFRKIMDDLKDFQIRNSMTLCLGGIGEVFLYPHLETILNWACDSDLFHTIYIESFFYQVSDEIWKILKKYSNQIILIIKLPTLDEKQYENLMGINRLPDIKENIKKIPDEIRTYVEILRIWQVEEELDTFFEYFRNTSIRPIVGKYNTYGGILQDYKAVDLEPLEKDYCRNLMFSLYIDSSGRVPKCRQDIFCRYSDFSIHSLSLKEIFFRLQQDYEYFIKKEYKQIMPICDNCKDWYVFLG